MSGMIPGFSSTGPLAEQTARLRPPFAVFPLLGDVGDATRTVRFLAKHGGFVIVLIKNRLTLAFDASATGGYRDMLLNVRVRSIPHVGELQLHIGGIISIKPKAHRVYEILRSYGWQGESL